MGRRGFAISMDLMLALGVLLIMIALLTEFTPYKWNRYSYVSDAVSIIEHWGVLDTPSFMEAELSSIIPFESYNFTIIDFGHLTPLTFCSSDAECNPAYPKCIFYLCGKNKMNIEAGEYQQYSSEPLKYCSIDMISTGACKPDGTMSQRIILQLGSDDLIDNFYIIRLEVAE